MWPKNTHKKTMISMNKHKPHEKPGGEFVIQYTGQNLLPVS